MDDLKKIKELYGEKMMHLCRTLFPTILEKNGLLSEIMLKNFEPYKFLYDDLLKSNNIESFKDYILKRYYEYFPNKIELEEQEIVQEKTPFELLDEAGYILYECKEEKDIQRFEKFYYPNEKLCTFKGGRLSKCFVFFAVKKDVDNIRRKDFPTPERQDKYGTSVISIQFTRGENNTLSIKNRYNHTVANPDSTFSNNLDYIIDGLTLSFEKFYNFNITNKNKDKTGFEIKNYVRASDGKFYKYNYEINNIYYCPNNIIIDNYNVIKDYQQLERYLFLDYFILDLKEKTIKRYESAEEDSFLHDLTDIKKVDIKKDKETKNKEIFIYLQDKDLIKIVIDQDSNIIEYNNPNIKEVKDNFLKLNKKIRKLKLLNVEKIGDNFLSDNETLEIITIPRTKKIGERFLFDNQKLKEIMIPEVTSIENFFIPRNKILERVELSKVKKIPDYFMGKNNALISLDLPNAEEIGEYFLYDNKTLKVLNIPKVRIIKSPFLYSNEHLRKNIKLYEKILPIKIQEKIRAYQYNSNKHIISVKKIKIPNSIFVKLANKFIENRALNLDASKGYSK